MTKNNAVGEVACLRPYDCLKESLKILIFDIKKATEEGHLSYLTF